MADKPGDVDVPKKDTVETATTEPEATPAAAGTAAAGVGESQAKVATVEDVPDPDEDDLDDLDDMLDEFSTVKIDQKAPAVTPGPSKPETAPETKAAADDLFPEDEFAKQLQAGMADLLGEMESSPEMQAQFESIFKELGAAAAGEAAPPRTTARDETQGASFQDNIRRAMERMQASGESATAAATADSQSADDFMAEMLKQMQAGSVPGLGGEGGEEEFSKMLLGMMEQLTNKDILYEPMKELSDKFPEWLEKNKTTTSADDLKKYEEQHRLATEIVAKFEEASYSDSNATDREYIVERMQKMQAQGSPPSDLVGDMPSAQDALGAPDDEACAPQ